jgi:GTP-binding protein Era
MSANFRYGYIALMGRPNVGKSTLINRLVGEKISITSHRPQTTRHRILGIKTTEDSQLVFVDTPGFQTKRGKAINRTIQRTAVASSRDVDVLVLVIESIGWQAADSDVLRNITGTSTPVILAINKVDRLRHKEKLLPLIEQSRQQFEFDEIIPVSAKTGYNVDRFLDTVKPYLPSGDAGFPVDQLTDRSERFICAEFVREQLFRQLGQELPYATAVDLIEYNDRGRIAILQAQVWVDKPSHKAIVIGKNGQRLKQIGIEARKQLERFLGKQVHLELRVKVRSGWADNQAALNALGYNEDLK